MRALGHVSDKTPAAHILIVVTAAAAAAIAIAIALLSMLFGRFFGCCCWCHVMCKENDAIFHHFPGWR